MCRLFLAAPAQRCTPTVLCCMFTMPQGWHLPSSGSFHVPGERPRAHGLERRPCSSSLSGAHAFVTLGVAPLCVSLHPPVCQFDQSFKRGRWTLAPVAFMSLCGKGLAGSLLLCCAERSASFAGAEDSLEGGIVPLRIPSNGLAADAAVMCLQPAICQPCEHLTPVPASQTMGASIVAERDDQVCDHACIRPCLCFLSLSCHV